MAMIKLNLMFGLLVLCTSVAGAQSLQSADSVAANAGKAFLTNNPGCALSVGIIQNGRTLLHHYGATKKGSDHTPTDQTLYEIGSITKTFTSLILAHAVLEKRVKPDDDIRQFLPGTYPNLAYAGKPIQLIHLLNWTSGLPNNLPADPDAFNGMRFDSMAFAFVKLHSTYNKEKFLNDLHQVKLDTLPGLNPRHSNAAALLLGYILENIYHKPLSELLELYITGPLNMSSTYLTAPADQEKFLAQGYSEKGIPLPFLPQYDAPAFGIKSTVADMARYIQHQLDEKDPAVRLTHQAAWGSTNDFAFGWNWFMNRRFDGKLQIHEDGTTFGFTADVLLYPAEGFGVVLLTNECDRNSNDRLIRIADKIYDESNYTPAERASLAFGYSADVNKLLGQLITRGFSAAIPASEELKNKDPQFNLRENELNTWAYYLLRNIDKEKALEIFKLNTVLYPQSSNAFNSLAECDAILGYKELAIQNYRRSLELDPKNTDSAEHLKKLQQD
jgi:D-alanyl-D-alanine-carboxypeptidase/D-alanyl-D-alanine-endopeptidase